MPYKFTTLIFLATLVLASGCSQHHIGMWVEEPGSAPDADQDGVPDDADRCPKTPIESVVNAVGCSNDDDRDKVANRLDQCPGTPRGTVVDANGCAIDSDSDGVLNSADQCPDTPAGEPVDGRGCSLGHQHGESRDMKATCAQLRRALTEQAWGCPALSEQLPSLSGIHFSLDSAELKPSAIPLLEQVVEFLQRHPDAHLKIVGHTDSQGSDAYNQGLSQRRASSALQYLVARGVEDARLEALGKGESSAIASNATKAGRAKNRRVEFIAGYR